MDQLEISENVDTLFHSLENFTQNEGVIGKPVTQGNKTLMPVVSVTIGYGGGNASMKSQMNAAASNNGSSNTGSGALGLGAKLNTEAVIVFDSQSQDISMLPMNPNGASQIVDKIPQIISNMNQGKQGNTQTQQPQG
ncbi:sporulation protein [Caproiciproducens sp. NJN-50]|uniref:GerW family sporulation protein n=1 Tax=Acutalibacteraceae TaxID=3082771 RepID=UPI000FFE1444|nr:MULTISPECIES: spore germination protein GerW family protein [Acutalibacteraceae]QAT50535.1 sporulation protein [Caproiciproducens sp. NJN-50]